MFNFVLESSKQSIWPILMSTSLSPVHVSVIGIFYGKPTAAELLTDLVQDLELLRSNDGNGLPNGISIKIGYFTCDTQAYSLIKCIKAPNGYASCPKCTIYGLRGRKCIYFCNELEHSAPRTDRTFRLRANDEEHYQSEHSPLESNSCLISFSIYSSIL